MEAFRKLTLDHIVDIETVFLYGECSSRGAGGLMRLRMNARKICIWNRIFSL